MTKILSAIALMLLLVGCGQVNPGERAVFATWGHMSQQCYGAGLYWYNPISTSMTKVSVQTQKYEAKKLTAASADIQEIHADVVLNYVVDGNACHHLITNVGWDYETKVIVPAITESLKAATAHFPIDKIIRERIKLRQEMVSDLMVKLAPYNIRIEGVALTEFGFAPSFSAAVEAKQVEEQKVQQAEYRRQQAVKEAEAAEARAVGQAKANRLLAESLKESPATIRFRELEVLGSRWNGQLPMYIMSGNATPLLKLPNPTGN